MGKIATKEATKQLQQLFDFLGEYGGVIKTSAPDNWWDLDLEVEIIENSRKQIIIGIFEVVNGDVVYDPKFEVDLFMDDKRIKEVEIKSCEANGLFGPMFVDTNDILHAMGSKEKDQLGLVQRFSIFMRNMTEVGPYLKEPKEVRKYNKTLAD